MAGNVELWPAKTYVWTTVTQDLRNGGPLEIAKPIKIKVLLRQFSLLMFNLRYIFLFVLLLDRGIAGIREMPHYNYPEGFEGRGEGKQKKKTTTTTTTTTKNKTLWELSFRHAFYLVRVVRVADIRVAWLVYIRTYCVPIATLNQNERSQLHYLGDAQIKKRT